MIDARDAVVYDGIGKAATKLKAYGQSLAKVGNQNPRLVVLSADLTTQTEADIFRDAHSDRFFSMGMAEQNMVGVAAGMARAGEIPFAHSFACFLTRRCFDQIAMSVAYPSLSVKLVGVMPGISSPGGASHQAIDDLAMMRATPNMTILDLGESLEVSQAVQLAIETEGPVYLRLRRGLLPKMWDEQKFTLQIKQSYLLKQGKDLTLITSGLMTERALQAHAILQNAGISSTVLHIPSIKPLDEEGILTAVADTRAIITLDNHNMIGGLGSAVAEVLMEHGISKPFYRIGVRDRYGKAASNSYLFRWFGFDGDQIAQVGANLLGAQFNLIQQDHKNNLSGEGSGWGTDWKKE